MIVALLVFFHRLTENGLIEFRILRVKIFGSKLRLKTHFLRSCNRLNVFGVDLRLELTRDFH